MIFYTKNIDANTKIGIWHITEPESFFLEKVPLQKDISHPKSRLQHLAGRYILQYLFPDFPYDEIEIADTKKPYLPSDKYHFSISHSGDYAAAIVSKTLRVGIDIEYFSPKVLRVLHKYLNEEELINFDKGDVHRMTTLWSCKEAIYKWWSYRDISLKNNMNIESMSDRIDATLMVDSSLIELDVYYKWFDMMSMCWIAD